MAIKFAHLADLHIGGWREKTLTELNLETFKEAIRRVIEKKVDFCLFAGDIFNSVSPPIYLVNSVVEELIKLKKAGIPLYIIGGSHDYSATGKSFLDLLETAGLFTNVARWKYVDKNEVELEWTWHNEDVLLGGIIGKKNGLDSVIYSNLSSQELPKEVFKIFLFHTTLNDLKPDFLKNYNTEVTSNYLPKGFDYYAGGHVHTYIDSKYSGGRLIYPGPLFPNSISELKRESPSFSFVTCDLDGVKVSREYINSYNFKTISYDVNMEEPRIVKQKLIDLCESESYEDAIVLLEVSGVVDGAVSEIGLIDVTKELYSKGALQVLKHTYNLSSSKLDINADEEIASVSVDEIENSLIDSYLEDDKKKSIMKSLLSLDLERQEEEKNAHYEDRVKEAIEKCL